MDLTYAPAWNSIFIWATFLVVNNLCYAIVTCTIFLFFLMVFSACSLCTVLSNRIENISNMTSQMDIKLELTKWKRHHWLVCRFVGRINACFELIVLLKVACSFISFTMKIYNLISQPYLFFNFQSQFCYAYSARFIISFFELCLVIYMSHDLKKKVISNN